MFSADPATASGGSALPDAVVAAVARLGLPAPIVLIDGPAGAGKSTLADRVAARWPGAMPVTVLRMDDLYPGWDGLEAGIRFLCAEVLSPLREGTPAAWRGYDWQGKRRGSTSHPVDASHGLIVEGCGTLSGATAPLADLTVWLDADDRVRKTRALARDRGAFDPFWQMWDEQFVAYVQREHPARRADLVLNGTP